LKANNRPSAIVTNSLIFRLIFSQFSFSKKKSEKLHFSISNSPEIRYILNSLVLRVEKLPSLSRKLKFPSEQTFGSGYPNPPRFVKI
jgi:hypothetical protein